jgi:hypothetical protein
MNLTKELLEVIERCLSNFEERYYDEKCTCKMCVGITEAKKAIEVIKNSENAQTR